MSELIAFIGVGNMGNPMAENLIKAGKNVRVYDVSKEMINKAKEKKFDIANNINDLLKDSVSTVITMLPAGKHSKEVYLGKELGPGKTIVTILCDKSDKYNSKLFNKKFLQEKDLPYPNWL